MKTPETSISWKLRPEEVASQVAAFAETEIGKQKDAPPGLRENGADDDEYEIDKSES